MKRRVRRARNEPPVVEERWRPGLFHLLGIALLLTIVAAFLRSNDGVRLGLPGAFVWVTALFIAFGLRLVDLSRFVLPPEAEHDGAKGWQEGLRMLLYYFAVIMLPESLRPRFHRRREGLPPEVPASFAEFQAGFVNSHLALALGRGTGFARAAGPGYVRLNRGERISQVVDLRRQIRREDVEAFTSDGIRLETSVAVSFRVRGPEGEVDISVPFPYDPRYIFSLTYSDGVRASAEVPWHQRIAPEAASLLVAVISRYRLDQFYGPGSGEASDAVSISDVVNEVEQQFTEQLEALFETLEACPLENVRISVGRLDPPEEVETQRIENWQGTWEKRKALYAAEGGAFEIREMQRMHARALTELIEYVTDNLEEMRGADRETVSQVFILRVADILERLVSDQHVQIQTPQQVFETLSRASTWLKELPPGSDES